MITAVVLCSSALSVQCFAEFNYNSNVLTDGIFKYILSDDGEEACLIGIDNNFKGVVELPERLGDHPLVEIGPIAFYEVNNGVTEIRIPSCVRTIKENPYSRNKNIISITVDSESQYFKVIDNVLFTAGIDELIGCPQKKSGDYTLPDTVQKIRNNAFYCCQQLTSITLPNGLIEISDSAFIGCEGLTTIEIPDSVKTIGSAFIGCTELTTVTIGENAENITVNLCGGCMKLENVFVSSKNKHYCEIDGVLFTKDRKKIIQFVNTKTSYVIPEGVTDIAGVFNSAEKLKDLTIASTVKGPVEEYLRECKLLQNITYPSTTKEIEIEHLFDHVLRNIFIDPNNKTFCDIDGVLFSKDKKKLILFPPARTTDGKIIYTIPDGVEEVGRKSFYGVNLERRIELTVPDSVQKISYEAFSNAEMVTIYGKTGSYAEKYASRLHGVKFVDPDAALLESSEEPAESVADMVVSEEEQQTSNSTEKYVLYIVIGLVVILIALIVVIVIQINHMKKKTATSATDVVEAEQEPEQTLTGKQNGMFNIVDEPEQESIEETAAEPIQEPNDESIPEQEPEFTFGSIDDSDTTKE